MKPSDLRNDPWWRKMNDEPIRWWKNFDDAFSRLTQSTRVTDRRTDGQTELAWHIRAIAYMLSRVKTQKISPSGTAVPGGLITVSYGYRVQVFKTARLVRAALEINDLVWLYRVPLKMLLLSSAWKLLHQIVYSYLADNCPSAYFLSENWDTRTPPLTPRQNYDKHSPDLNFWYTVSDI